MKLWHKISIVVFLFTLAITEIILSFVTPKIEREIISLHGEKLKAIAATASAYIDGDVYMSMNFTEKSIVDSDEFKNFRERLERVKQNLNLKEELYTVALKDSNKAIFGVMTNDIPFAGDTLHIKSPEAIKAYNRVRRTVDCSYTQLYMDQYGSWISGMAPITNSKNEVVGIVQADHEAETVYAKIDEMKNFILYVQLAAIPFLLFVSIFVSKLTTKPITEVIANIERISKGDYREGKKVGSVKEVRKLAEATDNLCLTILEQQKKIFSTIEELKKKNTELNEAKVKAEDSDRLKSEFLAMISHEVRTPLNVILNYLSLIEMDLPEDDETDARKFFSSVRSSANRLIRTIELIITTAQLQTGTYDYKEEDVDLIHLAIQLREYAEQCLKNKNVELIYNIDVESAIVKGNEILVLKTFENLMDNAITYTEEGFIKISLSGTEGGVLFVIEDTGKGMSEEFQRRMFNIFEQGDSGYSRKYDGNGLGLALVKLACDLQGIKIGWKSEVNAGTTFSLKFTTARDNYEGSLEKESGKFNTDFA